MTHLNDLHESLPYTQAERALANSRNTGYPEYPQAKAQIDKKFAETIARNDAGRTFNDDARFKDAADLYAYRTSGK